MKKVLLLLFGFFFSFNAYAGIEAVDTGKMDGDEKIYLIRSIITLKDKNNSNAEIVDWERKTTMAELLEERKPVQDQIDAINNL